MTSIPTAVDVSSYLGGTHDLADVESALAAEAVAQATACRVSAYNEALAEALRRRVARNLSMKSLPLGVQADPMGGATRIGRTDPEVVRLEAPYRRLVCG